MPLSIQLIEKDMGPLSGEFYRSASFDLAMANQLYIRGSGDGCLLIRAVLGGAEQISIIPVIDYLKRKYDTVDILVSDRYARYFIGNCDATAIQSSVPGTTIDLNVMSDIYNCIINLGAVTNNGHFDILSNIYKTYAGRCGYTEMFARALGIANKIPDVTEVNIATPVLDVSGSFYNKVVVVLPDSTKGHILDDSVVAIIDKWVFNRFSEHPIMISDGFIRDVEIGDLIDDSINMFLFKSLILSSARLVIGWESIDLFQAMRYNRPTIMVNGPGNPFMSRCDNHVLIKRACTGCNNTQCRFGEPRCLVVNSVELDAAYTKLKGDSDG